MAVVRMIKNVLECLNDTLKVDDSVSSLMGGE